MSWLNNFDRNETYSSKTTVTTNAGKTVYTQNKSVQTFNGVGFALALIFVFILCISIFRNVMGVGSEPLTFRALLEILSNTPVFNFASNIYLNPVDIPVDWLVWFEGILNASISVMNFVIFIVSNLINFVSYIAYFAYNLLGLNLGF